jgi:hypothetical protein
MTTLPTRYNLTYVKDGESWLIVDHHASAMPMRPKQSNARMLDLPTVAL